MLFWFYSYNIHVSVDAFYRFSAIWLYLCFPSLKLLHLLLVSFLRLGFTAEMMTICGALATASFRCAYVPLDFSETGQKKYEAFFANSQADDNIWRLRVCRRNFLSVFFVCRKNRRRSFLYSDYQKNTLI